MDVLVIAGAVVLIVVPVLFILWSGQKKSLGTIRCNRCGYEGPAKGLFVPFRGIKPVCKKCQGDDWVTLNRNR